MIRESGTDIDRYHFIDDFCRTAHAFLTAGETGASRKANLSSTDTPAQVVDLRAYRQRRLRWRA